MSTKELKNIVARFKSVTTNGRLASIRVVRCRINGIPSIVIVNRILATQSDIDNNYYTNFSIIKKYKEYVLIENMLGFKDTTFDKIIECVSFLRINYNV